MFPVSNRRRLEFGLRRNPWRQHALGQGGRLWLFASGREALLAAVRCLPQPGRGAVLLPAFVPEGLVAPFGRCGWRIELYRVDRDLNPDWEDLERCLRVCTPRIAVLVHFFGLIKDAGRFAALAAGTGALVVEDCAHTMFGAVPEVPAGCHGDLVLYSLPKMLGVPDGAVLRTQHRAEALTPIAHAGGWRHALCLAQNLLGLALARLGDVVPGPLGEVGISALTRALGGNPYSTLMRRFHNPAPMSRLSLWLLERIDLEKAAERRRLLARAYACGLDPGLFPPLAGASAPEAVLMGFPVASLDREGLVRRLRRHGVAGVRFVKRWDFIPKGEEKRHDAARWVMEHHYLFPLYHSLTLAQVDRVIGIANGPAGRGSGHP